MCARKVSGLFDLELPPTVDAIVRRIERKAGVAIEAKKVKNAPLGPCVGYFDAEGTPRIECAGKPSVEDLVLETLRLYLRQGRVEGDMPYGEMQIESNRLLCARLFRILEEDILFSEAAVHGIDARTHVYERLRAELIEPLAAGRYRKKDKATMRARLGALDALECAVASIARETARARLREISEADARIGRSAAFMYAVLDRYRPFDTWERMTAAYYVAVPFLYEHGNHA